MSEEHVAHMNQLLEADADVRAACAQLGRTVVLGYRLLDAAGNQTRHVHIAFDDTVRFGLTERPDADVVETWSWRDMVLGSAAARTGADYVPQDPIVVEGDDSAKALTAPAFQLARVAASVPITFPAV